MELFTCLKKLHKHLLDDFIDIEVLTSSSARITGSFFKKRNLSIYDNLRICMLNNDNKTADAAGIICRCF